MSINVLKNIGNWKTGLLKAIRLCIFWHGLIQNSRRMHSSDTQKKHSGIEWRKIKPGWFRFSKAAWFCFETRERLFPLPDYAFSESKVGKRLK